MAAPRSDRQYPTLLTFHTYRTHLIFAQELAARSALEQVSVCARQLEASLHGYCLLPSRFWLIVTIPGSSKASDFIQLFIGRSSRTIRKIDLGPIGGALHEGGKFQLWRKNTDIRRIETESEFKEKLGFIHLRPVKAGLVEDAAEWPYSSAPDWLGTGGGPIEINKEPRWE